MSINKTGQCSLCGGLYQDYGNNPEPLARYEERCCNTCNNRLVIPARINRWQKKDSPFVELDRSISSYDKRKPHLRVIK